MSDPSRRFTDREVALVLRKAVELDEQRGSGDGGGLSIGDLREIGKEVGISADAIDRAAQTLERPLAPGYRLAGAPLVHKAIRAVPAELSEEAIAELVRVIDEETDTNGAVSEALGSVRWIGSDRLKSKLVAVTPRDGETTIQVVEKTVVRLRNAVTLVPALWGVILAMPAIAVTGGLLGAAMGVGAAVLGGGAGRAVWSALSARSARRVERLADRLTERASHATPPAALPEPE